MGLDRHGLLTHEWLLGAGPGGSGAAGLLQTVDGPPLG
ncbi:Hypothetical protein AA314_00061 [Archangium gephyra]|uniref:Uncharacterized protein n=1 Tax=Archangium gephyra TaxID=48 RepID=A0AAC8PZW7_9BACT|nr:Hypothetical protein AA314_00061 [Archangium gephyra]